MYLYDYLSYLQCNYLQTVSLSICLLLYLSTFSGYLIINSSFPARRTSTCRVFFLPSSAGFPRADNNLLSSFPDKCMRMSFLPGWLQISFKQLVTISGDSKFLRSFKTISGGLLERGDTTFLFCCPLTPLLLPILPLSSSLNATLPFCGFDRGTISKNCTTPMTCGKNGKNYS